MRSLTRYTRARVAMVAAFSMGLTGLGCGPSVDMGFRRAIAAGDRAKTAGRHLEAAERYEAAASATGESGDRSYALSLAASSYARSGNRADAARLLTVLEATPPPNGNVALRARFDRALLTLRTDQDAGLTDLERFVTEHPESALSRRALSIVLERRAQGDAKARLSILERVLPRTRGTELEERVRYEIALAHETLGDGPRARDLLLALASAFPYPKGALFDDALYRASEIEERLGDPKRAIEHLERMLVERETTHLIGSYERPKYQPAAMRIALLYRDRLNDLERARAAFLRVYDDFPHSTKRDDALFEAALVARRLNDQEGVCGAMRKLIRNLPESRYVACAVRLCPAIGEGATRQCADYLIRRIDDRR